MKLYLLALGSQLLRYRYKLRLIFLFEINAADDCQMKHIGGGKIGLDRRWTWGFRFEVDRVVHDTQRLVIDALL
ncbi:hypothetical protein [Teredinibacter turnerae]|uniref:hypothetical protein n=1 Tax=Teredinibacter turnerae TaxID=2426 RepID=UPI0003147448